MEFHWSHHVADPVISFRYLHADRLSSDVRDQLAFWRGEFHAAQHAAEFIQHWLHQLRMKGMRDPQFLASDPRSSKPHCNGFNRLSTARNDYIRGPIDSRNKIGRASCRKECR